MLTFDWRDKEVMVLALDLAMQWERSYIASFSVGVDKKDLELVKDSQKNIERFRKLMERIKADQRPRRDNELG